MNEEELTFQQSEPVHPNEIYSSEMQQQRVANVLAQTSPDNQLADIEWRIRGYRKNMYTGEWEKIKDAIEPHPLLVGRYISFLGSILNDGTRFTNLSSRQINDIMRLIIEYLSDDLTSHAQEYGLYDEYTDRTRIGLIILNQTFIVLKRAENGMESRRIWNILNVNESLTQMPIKKSFFDKLAFWK